jgi:DNA-binding MarR family transcriptional regulator
VIVAHATIKGSPVNKDFDVMSNDLSDSEILSLKALGHAVRLFKESTSSPIQATGIGIFCAIAGREGRNVEAYRKLVGINFNLAGRLIADLSDRNRYGSHGAGLVEKRIGDDQRESVCFLTVKGKAFAKRVAAAIAPARPQNPARDAAEKLFADRRAEPVLS